MLKLGSLMTYQPSQRLIAHALMVGLTPLIPIPFVDDMVRSHLTFRMVRDIAHERGIPLTREEARILAEDPGPGCLKGCLQGCMGGLVVMLLKRILRKLFFLLEWRRTVELVSHSYTFGWLLEVALYEGWYRKAPGAATPEALRDTLLQVCKSVGTSPVKHAVSLALSGGKKLLQDAADEVKRRVGRPDGPPSEEKVDEVADAVEHAPPVENLVTRLQSSFQQLPEEYFQRLRRELERQVNQSGPLS